MVQVPRLQLQLAEFSVRRPKEPREVKRIDESREVGFFLGFVSTTKEWKKNNIIMKKVKKSRLFCSSGFYFDRDFWVSNGCNCCNAMVFWGRCTVQVWFGRWPLLWSQTVEPPQINMSPKKGTILEGHFIIEKHQFSGYVSFPNWECIAIL